MLDEHGLLPCDDSLGRLDAWYADLSNNPNSIGLAVVSGPPEEKHRSVFRQHLMQANARFRKASEVLELKYVRANSPGEIKIQLWRIPAGGGVPRIENVDNTFSLPGYIKPFRLGTEYPEFVDDICPGDRSEKSVFAAFLSDNPTARGNIVVRGRTLTLAKAKAARILRTLKGQYAIAGNRLHFFPRKRSVPLNNLEPIVEYWYLP
ncbi:MAG: hypothetical protein HOP17_11350 [Acidobacteria bacterium]|nr:hypothetical protein [Acidobacteriota bacterium]